MARSNVSLLLMRACNFATCTPSVELRGVAPLVSSPSINYTTYILLYVHVTTSVLSILKKATEYSPWACYMAHFDITTGTANKKFIALTIVAVGCSMLQQTISQRSLVQSVLAVWMRSYGSALGPGGSFLVCAQSPSKNKQLSVKKMAASAGFCCETAPHYFVTESAFKKA